MPFTSETARKAGKKSKRGAEESTKKAREALSMFVDDKSEKLDDLFERVAEKDPKGALDILAKMMEYALPKLSRTEFSGEIQEKSSIDPSKYTKEELMQLKQLIKKGKNAEQG